MPLVNVDFIYEYNLLLSVLLKNINYYYKYNQVYGGVSVIIGILLLLLFIEHY
jgi:hypothetical protein